MMAKVLMLNDVRCSFLVLGEPEDFKTNGKGNGKFRWSATALIPYKSPILKQIEDGWMAEAVALWGTKAKSNVEMIMTDPKASALIDGKRKDYEGYAEHMALTAHRYKEKGPPAVLLRDRSHVYYRGDKSKVPTDVNPDSCVLNAPYPGREGKLYSGCFVNMQVELWAQKNTGNGIGLRCSLLGIQFWRDGDSFGGGTAPSEDAFPDMADGADSDDLAG
jgi:hypothetical protein